ncbi:MAG: DUF1328 domain-containing protein [Gemmatimonadota bacterium]
MLRWNTSLYVIGLVVAVLGFGGLTIVTAALGRVLIILFLSAFLVSLIALAIGVSRYEQGQHKSSHQALGNPLSAGTEPATD